MRDGAGVIEMCEPGAADGALPQNTSHGRRLYDRWRQPALSSEVPPRRRVQPNRLSLGPAGGDGSVRLLLAPCPIGWLKAWRQSSECSQTLSDMSEAKPRLEPLHEAKDVALSLVRWIPPTAPSMADDQDLALASSVLEAEFRALLSIKLPAWRCLLQHNGAMHLFAQFLDFVVVSGHIHSSRLSAGAGLSGHGLVFAPAPSPNRETVGLQGRAERAEACDEPLQRDRR